MKIKSWLSITLIPFITGGCHAIQTLQSSQPPSFEAQVSQQYHVPPAYTTQVLAMAKILASVQEQVNQPARDRRAQQDWTVYRKNALHPLRLKNGLRFMQQYHDTLQQAEQRYGVPATIITSIIGLETNYGAYMGKYNTLDTLYTLAFYHPIPSQHERIAMFRQQLGALIDLAYHNRINLKTTVGSYTGAIGLPQFMPLSIEKYAVNAQGEKSGQIDLSHNVPDAIMSIGNYLKEQGWKPLVPIFIQYPLDAKLPQHWKRINLLNPSTGKTEVRVGTQNFAVLHTYNKSDFYVSAIADFAQELANHVNHSR